MLSKQYGLLASAIGQSCDWSVKNETLFIIAKSAFNVSLLQKHSDILQSTVSQLTGHTFKIAIKEFVQTEKDEAEKIEKEPKKILLIKDIFMGKIVEKKAVESVVIEDEENDFTNMNSGGI